MRRPGAETTRRTPRAHEPWRDRLWATLALSALTLFVVVTNLLWVRAHRSDVPFDIDESGYLQRSLRDAAAIHQDGVPGLWRAFRLPDPQAPLLPVAAGVWHELSGAGPVGLIAVQQAFVAIAIVSTFLLARHLGASHVAAVVAAACTAALPGVIDGGRGFAFAVPAAALMTATLACQLTAGDFKRLRPALAWGLVFGLATLTRTVMLALLPAAVLAAVVRLALLRAGLRQWLHLAAGVLVALFTASSWYSATWHLVWSYLTGYGYGQQAAGFGQERQPLSWDTWTFRLEHVLDSDVHLPLAIAAVACAAAAAGRLVSRRPTWKREPQRVAAHFLSSGWGTVTLVLAVDYAWLSSTRNIGTHFELALLPAALALLVSAACPSGRTSRVLALSVAAGAAAFSLVATEGLLPRAATRQYIQAGPFSGVVYDDRGPAVQYGAPFLARSAHGPEPALRRWERSNRLLTSMILQQGRRRGQPAPVVFLSLQEPFINTNSIGLVAQERGVSLRFGILASSQQAGESLAAQLDDPARGRPDVVVLGPPPPNPTAAQFAPHADTAEARRAAAFDGFRRSGTLALPDGRQLELWWRAPN